MTDRTSVVPTIRREGRVSPRSAIAETGGTLEAFVQAVDACDDPRDAAAGAEVAVWALAWITRSRRSAGAAGALLERLVRRAEAALPALSAGDTSSARFVLALGRLFRDVEACRHLADDASAAVEREVVALAAAGGAVRRAGSAAILATVLEWAAFRATADATGGPAWSERCEDAFVSSLETAVRLLDASGQAVVAAAEPRVLDTAVIIDAARRLGGRPLASTAKKMARRESPATGLPRDVRHVEERLAILRSGWRRRDVRILVDARGPAMHLEIAV
ncbi:MAG: hypothetical protein EBU70_10245, partial [Actinobacteria bacterium]|nr:hypothetical protein [Actinomycetota bacterium]